jgi:hypothetical protein
LLRPRRLSRLRLPQCREKGLWEGRVRGTLPFVRLRLLLCREGMRGGRRA